jgi:putative ABC transport system substrate-binding protein
MRDLGYVEGKKLVTEWRFAEGTFERLPGLAAELVQLKVDVIVTVGPQATSAAQKSSATIPIVMVVSNDPVRSGLVASLAHPGGNITGVSNFSDDLTPKHVEMLLSMVPKLSRLAILTNPTNAGHSTMLKSIETAAQKFRVKMLAMEARSLQEINSAFAIMVRERAGAIIVMLDPVFVTERRPIAELAAKHRLPSVASFREYVEDGGLMSYGQNLAEHFRRMTTYVDKIFKAAKPADLPVEQPTKFELIINRKTASALGLSIPQSLLISADKMIE